MSRILFYLFIKPLSLLPLSVLYPLSKVLYLFLYPILGFRKKVVWTNLRNAFPERSEKEIKQLARRFYRYFSELIIEGVRMFSMPHAEAIRRMRLVNPELINQYYDQGKSIFITIGHYNNWEYAALAMNAQMKHQAVGIYAPLANPFFNQKFHEIRSQLGILLVPKRETTAFVAQKHPVPVALLMGTDQSPTFSKSVYWTTFLNQDTAVMVGTERFSKRYDFPVFFGRIQRVKRGYYEMTFSLIEAQPTQTADGELTEKHTRMLEQEILEAPEFWLWTHKRWKRKRDEPTSPAEQGSIDPPASSISQV